MKRIVLFLLASCAIVFSCSKSVKTPLSYSVTTLNDSVVRDVYLPAIGSYDMAIQVKFLSGYQDDQVMLKIKNLPPYVKVTPDSMNGTPTYVQHFVFSDSNALLGTYAASIVAYTPTTGYQTFNFNINIIPSDCAATLFGSFQGKNSCKSANYTYAATGVSINVKNKLTINNFGGYGPSANALLLLDCTNGSVTMAPQAIGNGVTVQGSGTFTATRIIINYSGTTPSGLIDNCSDTLTRN